jgi:hypothetical protein
LCRISCACMCRYCPGAGRIKEVSCVAGLHALPPLRRRIAPAPFELPLIQLEERLPNQKSNVGTRSPNATPCGNGCCDASRPGYPKTAPAMGLGEKVLVAGTRRGASVLILARFLVPRADLLGGAHVLKNPHAESQRVMSYAQSLPLRLCVRNFRCRNLRSYSLGCGQSPRCVLVLQQHFVPDLFVASMPGCRV